MVDKLLIPDEHLEELIHQYCRDFTKLARQGRYDPISGRDEEIDNIILILLQKGRKNALLLAPAGVGKTALCVGLAQKIVSDNVPEYLKNARLLEVDMASMAAGTSTSAEFQERFVPLCKGLAERYARLEYPRYIMFLDEIHTIMPMVEGSAYRGLSEVMKPYLTAGDLHVIGATTADEYRLFVKEDPALDRRFQKIPLAVPDAEQTVAILDTLKPGYEQHHGISIPHEALEIIVKITEEHMRRRNQPDKSIILLDAACAHHVKENGLAVETLDYESIYYMASRETGVHPEALK